MSVGFSAKISMLRKEKNITQKKAAEDLDISQALLSHYEKGIRECNLEFVKKTAVYYGVSADYLLGLSDLKYGTGEIFNTGDIAGDAEINSMTVLRALIFLYSQAEKEGDEAKKYFNDYFSVLIKKYASEIYGDDPSGAKVCGLCGELMAENRKKENDGRPELAQTPLSFRTVTDHAGRVASGIISGLAVQNVF